MQQRLGCGRIPAGEENLLALLHDQARRHRRSTPPFHHLANCRWHGRQANDHDPRDPVQRRHADRARDARHRHRHPLEANGEGDSENADRFANAFAG